MNKTAEHKPNILNKLVYTVFVITGIVFIFLKDFSSATVFMGTSLVFDPFDQKVPFGKRPLWQRGWLIIHLAATFVLFWFMIKNSTTTFLEGGLEGIGHSPL